MDNGGTKNGTSLPEEVQWPGPRGSSFTGDYERNVERLRIRAALNTGACLRPKGTWDMEGGSLTGDYERRMKEGSRNGAKKLQGDSMRETWNVGSFTGDSKNILRKALE
jgi:hypothetical protein